MKKLAVWFFNTTGAGGALVGAVLVGVETVELFYLLTGRIQAGQEHPPVFVVLILLFTGVLLLVAGYTGPKRLAARWGADSDNSNSASHEAP